MSYSRHILTRQAVIGALLPGSWTLISGHGFSAENSLYFHRYFYTAASFRVIWSWSSTVNTSL